MMSTEAGRNSLAQIMQHLAEHYCEPIDSAQMLAGFYPGGLYALEKELAAWLNDSSPKTPHTY